MTGCGRSRSVASPSRRTLLTGLAGGLAATLAGCDADAGVGTGVGATPSASPSSSGPVINQQRLGNVVTEADLQEMAELLTRTFTEGDWRTFRGFLHRYDEHDAWRRIMEGFSAVPMEGVRFYVQLNDSRMSNASGGPVEAHVDLALAHRIRGCDAQPLAQTVAAEIRKRTEDGPVVPFQMGLPSFGGVTTPAWELAAVTALESPHVVLIARERDASLARSALPAIEQGVARAMAYLPPAAGVEKLCITLGWPEARSALFGGSPPEFWGTAHAFSFVDPQELADAGGERLSGAPFAGSRIVIQQEALESTASTERVAAHEAIHALAMKWGHGSSAMHAEGYARWFDAGGASGFTANVRAVARSGFDAFRKLQRGDDGAAFYRRNVTDNYACAQAVYTWAESTQGTGTPRALAEAAYSPQVADAARETFGMAEGEMLEAVAAWL